MSAREPFTFGIPLLPKAAARNWPLVEALLRLTLTSLRAQTDTDFRIVIAGHDRPDVAGTFEAEFIEADWVAEPVRSDNRDSGRKKSLIGADVAKRGGGLLMFVDADDWIGTRLVAAARATILPEHVGGILTRGEAIDLRSLRGIALPHDRLFSGGFHELCGSSIVARYDLASRDPVRRDPFAMMHEHYRWVETCAARGLSWRDLGAGAAYVVNTTANHSEVFGPHARWRRAFVEGIADAGAALGDVSLARFGLNLAALDVVRTLV